jgi:hypothetical protein
MKTRAITTFVSVLALAALATSAGQAVKLQRVPKVGEKATYKMKIDIAVQGMNINVAFDVVNTVTKVNEDGSYVLSEVNSNQLVTMDGQILEEGGEAITSEYTYAKEGHVTKIVSEETMGGEQLLANLTTIMWPPSAVDTGSKWDAKVKAGDDSPMININYEIVGREKVAGKDTFKIKFSAKGGESTNEGFHWVEIGTGITVKSLGQMKAVPIQGMAMDPQYLLEMKG